MKPQLDLELSKVDNLLRRFEEIHNFIYANDGLSPQQTLEEIIKILFIKIFDERNKKNLFNISIDEINNIKKSITSVNFINRISILLEETTKEYKDIFDIDEKIRLSVSSLSYTINKLQNISLSDSSNDSKGLAFQKFLAHQEKDSRGQFFTPEPIINFCVEIIQPKINETIIDPACGSGGFLISALNFLIKNNSNANESIIISNSLFGIDINKSIARIAKMKLLLESNGNTNIFCTNSLDDLDEIKLNLISGKNNNFNDGFDIVLTNPPFGTMGKITDRKILSQFEMGHKWTSLNGEYIKTKQLINAQSAEILFIERCLNLLKEGGRMCIVLPNGHFENSSLEYLRFFIKKNALILGIVNLPQETFIPYGTGVKTSLLFLKKDSSNIRKNYSIFFSKIKKIGYQGNKNGTPIYQKDKFGNIIKDINKNSLVDEDLSKVINEYKIFQDTNIVNTDNSFKLNYANLNGRFDYDFYSPENRNLISILINKNAVYLGDIAYIVKNKSNVLKQHDKVVEYIELSDINTHSFEIINSTSFKVHELPTRASYDIKTDDIITSLAGNSVGTKKHATALVTEEFNGFICSNGFRVLRNFKIDSFYLLYFLKSDAFLKQMFMYRTGAAIPCVSDNDFAKILVYLPNENTIKKIAHKMREAFNLRQESKKYIEDIEKEYQI
ncbi:MAG: SAM-dependent DNA methyltransferase [Ignavibacteriae bacterium]|nr:MAG: SAM-dependent DNA methyltransferase [Ignavibacteriota bacterium]